MKLSQEKMADILVIKRGRLTAYEDKSNGSPEFYQVLASTFNLDLNKFLTLEMNDRNYDSFFLQGHPTVNEDEGEYLSKSTIVDLIQKIKYEQNPDAKNLLADQAISLVAKLFDENNKLYQQLLKEKNRKE